MSFITFGFVFQVILNSQLQKSEILCKELRSEVSSLKDERLKLQGTVLKLPNIISSIIIIVGSFTYFNTKWVQVIIIMQYCIFICQDI